MNATQAGRLLTLAYFLKTQVKPHKFYMGSFAQRVGDRGYVELKRTNAALLCGNTNICGASACAIGWATAVFPAVFALQFKRGAYSARLLNSKTKKPINYMGRVVQQFFGITQDEADYLFCGIYCSRTPKQEAKHMEQLAAKYGWTYASPLRRSSAKRNPRSGTKGSSRSSISRSSRATRHKSRRAPSS